jgi:hypothetical protein
MNLQRPFHIVGSRVPRPAAERVIYCDGGIDAAFREGTDVELSHWIPNRTPVRFKADTSTEICFEFVAGGGLDGGFDLVVNNHLDVDGVLSVFVLLVGEQALPHRGAIVEAAQMGDFWGWGEGRAQELFQALSLLMQRLAATDEDPQDGYSRCLAEARAVLGGRHDPAWGEGLCALADSVALIESGEVQRILCHPRFVHYDVPRRVTERNLDAALHLPRFNAPLSSQTLLLPQARARWDRERIQLVSVEAATGWYYDLAYPRYSWADTPRSWRPDGLVSAGSSNTHVLDHPPLTSATATLSRKETARGEWTLARQLTPFSSLGGRNFPVVLSFMAGGAPAPSALPPALVSEHLADAFAAGARTSDSSPTVTG